MCNHLDEIWEEQAGTVVLFTWYQFLQDESLEHLKIIDVLKLEYCSSIRELNPSICPTSNDASTVEVKKNNRAVQDVTNKDEILPLMLEYNQTKKDEAFKISTFSCYICFEKKLGSKCMQFTGKNTCILAFENYNQTLKIVKFCQKIFLI